MDRNKQQRKLNKWSAQLHQNTCLRAGTGERGGCARLAQDEILARKLMTSGRSIVGGAEDLQSYAPLELQVDGAIDRAHTAATDLCFDPVALGDRGPYSRHVRQSVPSLFCRMRFQPANATVASD